MNEAFPDLEQLTGRNDHSESIMVPIRAGVGLLVEDSPTFRLLEGLAVQLDLTPVHLEAASLEAEHLVGLELVIADEALALTLRSSLRRREETAEHVHPALIAIRQRDTRSIQESENSSNFFEGVLTLPQEPALLLAQLSVILFAHRAYIRRFRTAMEELQLNRRIFRSVTSGISIASATDPDMPLVYVNPAFEIMTGYSFEEVQGNNCRFLQAHEHDQPGLTLVREAIHGRREIVAILRNYRKDGSFFWNELSLSPIKNREGKVTHFVGIQMDVTSRVEFESALRESEKLAAVGRLAASIAHEINNPLEAVTNLLYLARESDDLSQTHTYVRQAEEELHRASQITSQSLRFYKQSSNPLAVRPTALLDAVLDLYHVKFTNAHITVERRERMCESIVCLESEIRQVLANLIRNAIDAMSTSGGRIFIRSREATEWRSGIKGVMITIADTGVGINPDAMKSLYTAFFTTKGIGGTGLGLWVSSEIVGRHHGRIRVRSRQHETGSWTVFELYLPYQGLAT